MDDLLISQHLLLKLHTACIVTAEVKQERFALRVPYYLCQSPVEELGSFDLFFRPFRICQALVQLASELFSSRTHTLKVGRPPRSHFIFNALVGVFELGGNRCSKKEIIEKRLLLIGLLRASLVHLICIRIVSKLLFSR